MKKFGIIIVFIAVSLFANQAIATQEILETLELKNVTIVDTSMNYEGKICTITIDQDIPTSPQTEKCTKKKFSWKCFSDDYLWHMVLYINKRNTPIDVRYSSDGCIDDKSSNFKLLTAW